VFMRESESQKRGDDCRSGSGYADRLVEQRTKERNIAVRLKAKEDRPL
jgi:hypothetical protein